MLLLYDYTGASMPFIEKCKEKGPIQLYTVVLWKYALCPVIQKMSLALKVVRKMPLA